MSPVATAVSGLLAVAPLVWLLIFLVRRRKGTERHQVRLAAMREQFSGTKLHIPQPPGIPGK